MTGTNKDKLCPKYGDYGGGGGNSGRNINCNLSGREKIDPKTVYGGSETIYSSGDTDTDTEVNSSEPIGTLRGTIGLENPTPRNHTPFSWDSCWGGHRNDYIPKCFKKNNNPNTENVDEYWTRCGYGDAIKTKALIGKDKEDKSFYFEAENKSNTMRSNIIGSDFLFPDDVPGICSNIAFDAPPGYIHVATGDTDSRCDFFEEIKSQGAARDSKKNGVTNDWYPCSSNTWKAADLGFGASGCDWSQPWKDDDHIFFEQGAENDLIVIPPEAQACRFKYRKDWNNLISGAPPLCMNYDCSEINPDITHLQLETENVENLPEKRRLDTYYDDNLIPKIRMACCTNVDDSGNWDNNKLNKIKCPITKLDDYSNNDIKTKGYGVYDPKSHVCARYDLSDGLFDTPDNWCSYNILIDGFQGQGEDELLNDGIDTFEDEKYKRYIKLLTSIRCKKWLDLDFKGSRGWTEITDYKPEVTPRDRDSLRTYYQTKYRNKALGNKLSKFFVWVSKNLANPNKTPVYDAKVSKYLKRWDLIQAKHKIDRLGNKSDLHTTLEDNGDSHKADLYSVCHDQNQKGADIFVGNLSPDSIMNTKSDCIEWQKEYKQYYEDKSIPYDKRENYIKFTDPNFCDYIGYYCDSNQPYGKSNLNIPCERRYYNISLDENVHSFPCVKYKKKIGT